MFVFGRTPSPRRFYDPMGWIVMSLMLVTLPVGCGGCRQEISTNTPPPTASTPPSDSQDSQSETEKEKEATAPPATSSPETSPSEASAEAPSNPPSGTPSDSPESPESNGRGGPTSKASGQASSTGGSRPVTAATPVEARRLGADRLQQAQAAQKRGDHTKAFTLSADALALSRQFPDDAECQQLGADCEALLKTITPLLKPTGTPGAADGRALIEK